MSRWRETLCGSVMKAAYLEAESKKGLLSGATDVFSCGGNYILHSHQQHQQNQQINQKFKEKPSTIFLPKDQYSIIHGAGNNWQRYDEKSGYGFDEMDVTEVAMRYLDSKIFK